MAVPANREPLLELVMPRLKLWVEQEVSDGSGSDLGGDGGSGDGGSAGLAGAGHARDAGEVAT